MLRAVFAHAHRGARVTTRWIAISGLLLAFLAAFTTVRTSTASAESCFQTVFTSRGSYTASGCGTVGAPKNWVWGSNTFNWEPTTRASEYCVKVRAGNASWYTDVGCDKYNASTGEYSLLWAQPGWHWWRIAPITGKGKGVQAIQTTAGAVECEEATVGGEDASEMAKTQVLKLKYGKCTGFGSAVTVSEAEYEFNAEGPVGIVNKNITITDASAGCSVTIASGGSNKALNAAEYTNTAEGTIVAKSKLSAINYEPSGGACGTKKLETNGTYNGEAEIGQEGGSDEVELSPIEHEGLSAGGFWSVNGERLAAGKTHNIQARVYKGNSFTLTNSTNSVVITCKALKLEAGVLLGSNEGEPGRDSEITDFSECSLASGNGAPECELANEKGEKATTIKTLLTRSEQVENVENSKGGGRLLEEFRPAKASEGFVDLHFTGAKCTVTETIVSGSTVAEALTTAGQKIELGQTATEATATVLRFPEKPITQVWLISNGVGKIQKTGQVSFGTESVQTGTALLLLANTKSEPEYKQWSPLP